MDTKYRGVSNGPRQVELLRDLIPSEIVKGDSFLVFSVALLA
jgi:hypothetical protein